MDKNPIQVLEIAIHAGHMFNRARNYVGPGGIISRLSEGDRKVLGELRSTDIATLRADFVRIFLPDTDLARQLALDFDASIPKHFRTQ